MAFQKLQDIVDLPAIDQWMKHTYSSIERHRKVSDLQREAKYDFSVCVCTCPSCLKIISLVNSLVTMENHYTRLVVTNPPPSHLQYKVFALTTTPHVYAFGMSTWADLKCHGKTVHTGIEEARQTNSLQEHTSRQWMGGLGCPNSKAHPFVCTCALVKYYSSYFSNKTDLLEELKWWELLKHLCKYVTIFRVHRSMRHNETAYNHNDIQQTTLTACIHLFVNYSNCLNLYAHPRSILN